MARSTSKQEVVGDLADTTITDVYTSYERSLADKGRPNRRLQRTALRTLEIRAFLKAESARASFRSMGAPPLKRKPLGGLRVERLQCTGNGYEYD